MDQSSRVYAAPKSISGADLEDPILSVKTIAENVHKETIAQLRQMLTDHLDQISAANVQAESAAKARAEGIITQSAEWAAIRIREAGEAATARYVAESQKELADAKKELGRAAMAALFCAATAACAVISAAAVIWM